jgi:hypothetical protein
MKVLGPFVLLIIDGKEITSHRFGGLDGGLVQVDVTCGTWKTALKFQCKWRTFSWQQWPPNLNYRERDTLTTLLNGLTLSSGIRGRDMLRPMTSAERWPFFSFPDESSPVCRRRGSDCCQNEGNSSASSNRFCYFFPFGDGGRMLLTGKKRKMVDDDPSLLNVRPRDRLVTHPTHVCAFGRGHLRPMIKMVRCHTVSPSARPENVRVDPITLPVFFLFRRLVDPFPPLPVSVARPPLSVYFVRGLERNVSGPGNAETYTREQTEAT